jgi:hypothetical protein
MFVYFFLKLLIFIHGKSWSLLTTSMGSWYLFEILGLVLAPCLMFLYGVRHRHLLVIRVAAIIAMRGVIINRLNYSMIAFKWYVPLSKRYIPSWMEIVVTLAIILTEIWAFRWVVNRMPVLRRPPEWAMEEKHREEGVRIGKEVPQWTVSPT